jgi:RNA polymerase sigma-70 factor, ECF subfamily
MPQSDTELVKLARGGDDAAYAELVRRHYGVVVGLCGSMLGSARAEDAAQDVFIKAYEALGGFQGGSSFSTWVHRIAANRCLDLLRQDARRRQDSLDGMEEETPGALDRLLAGRDDAAHSVERADVIEKVLSALTPDQRLILTLREAQGLSYEELTETLGVSLDAVKARLRRARAALDEIVRHFSAKGDV